MTGATSSRLVFPEDRVTFVYQRPGQPILTPPRTGLKIFVDEACTTPADIRTPLGAAIEYSTIYTAPDSLVPEFLGPEGFVNQRWARVVGGVATPYPLMAQYTDPLANLPTLVTGDGPPTSDLGAVGSYYIDQGLPDPGDPNGVAEPLLYGPRTLAGWPSTGTPLRGASGPTGGTQEWRQVIPLDRWEIPHTLPYRPNVSILDTANEQGMGTVSWPAPNLVVVTFGAPIAGTALLS